MGYKWIVDPLDGTVNYAHNFPHFAVSIAVANAQGVHVGVVYDPMRDELFTAQRGQPAWLNGRRLAVSHTTALQQASWQPASRTTIAATTITTTVSLWP